MDEYTKEDIERLRSYRHIIDSEDIKIKQKIKEKLLANKDILHVLNNPDCEEPDDYFGFNILPYYIIHPTQIDVQNFICYTVDFKELERYNKKIKYQLITFVILCEQKNIIDKDTFLPRHDLLAALLMDEFDWTNYFGIQIHCVSDQESVVDNDYACRTLVFQQVIDNNITKTRDGVTRVVTHEVHT